MTFLQIFCNLICGFARVKIISIQATTQNFIVAFFLQNKSWYKIPQVYAENTENSLNLVPHTIEITIQIGEKFSPIVNKKFGIFSKCHRPLSHHHYKLLLHKVSQETINCS